MYLLNVVEHTLSTQHTCGWTSENWFSFNTVGQGSNSVSQAWQQAPSLLSRLSHQGSLSLECLMCPTLASHMLL